MLRVVVALVAASITQAVSAQPAPRAVSVEDLARFAVFGDPGDVRYPGIPREAGSFSPDGRYYAAIVRRGNPEQGTNEARLLVYRTKELLRSPEPQTVAEFSSFTNNQPIALMKWLADSNTLVFVGAKGEEPSQVYRFDLNTQRLEALTQEPTQLIGYDIASSGNRMITVREAAIQRPAENPQCRQRGCLVTGTDLYRAMEGMNGGSIPLRVHDLRTGDSNMLAPPENLDPSIKRCDERLFGEVSPDGRFAIRMCELHEYPAQWSEYSAQPMRNDQWRYRSPVYAQRLVLIDLDRGTTTPVSDAPFMAWSVIYARPLWIDGGRRFILPGGAMESLEGTAGHERELRASTMGILLVDPVTRKARRIAQLDANVGTVSAASWEETSRTLTVETRDDVGTPLPVRRYQLRNDEWVAHAEPVSDRAGQTRAGVNVVVEQSLNERPVLVAVDFKTGAKQRLLDPNPWLAQRKLGRVEAISWKSKDGREWNGGLYYPADFQPGKRYPLVLLPYGFRAWQFSLSGIVTPYYAARALNAQGIVVLESVHNKLDEIDSTTAVWSVAQAGHESAIDYLDARGLIDRNRVGIQGFSYSGPQVAYTLTHSSYPFAACALTSTVPTGWWYYLSKGGNREYEPMHGGPPFGEQLKGWLETASGFSIDRVRTPMLSWGEVTLVVGWEWPAALRRLDKPVESWLLADGQHNVFKVPERIMTNQLLVDWFRFWLKDEERSEPNVFNQETVASLAAQYVRWRALRKQQDAVLKTPRPPLLNWTATPISSSD